MRVMVLVKATEASETPLPIDPDALDAMRGFNLALKEAGVFVIADGLKPTSHAVRIGFDGDTRTAIEGPFLPASEQVAGYWIWEVKDMEDAIRWVERCPNPMPCPSEIEIRPIMTLEDVERR